ncbi:PD-(D/E)XK motif protein [Planococcus alpniumensis]|uniref:PD-(D/E)XK motif protein n=1 Tax=Planococcus alpniumensis TaxID=2708345 RepID=UPI001B8AEF2F|nr:PD-(D/E)XK motif protein [Planococcus sp. MSAK28401]
MSNVEEIRSYLSNIQPGKMVKLQAGKGDYDYWVFRDYGKYGVAVEIDPDIQVNERFSSAVFQTRFIVTNEGEKNFLCLTSGNEEFRYEFASICSILVDPGSDGEDRKHLLNNPVEWWSSYKQLIGNKAVSKEPYSILGELTALLWLYNINTSTVWSGHLQATVDIESNIGMYEVKSTTLRTDNIIQISNQFQLNAARNQFLIFCRFEKAEDGKSINETVDLLDKAGYPKAKLEQALINQGFEKNSLSREEKYRLYEMKSYPIDEKFPLINFREAVPNEFLDHIVKIMYSIDLKGIESEDIDLAFLA